MKSQEEQELHAKVERVREKLQGLAADLRVVDGEIESLAPQRAHHELIDQATGALEKLGELGATSLFWGERGEPARVAEQLRGARSRVSAFQAQLRELDERRRAILAKIGVEEENLEILGDDLYQAREQDERRKLEWVVEREISPVPLRVQLMAWARGSEDDRRFRRTLTASLLASLLLGALLPMIDLPLPKRFVPGDMPRRIAQLARKEQAKVLPPPPVVAEAQAEPDKAKPVEQSKPSQRTDPLAPETPSVAVAGPPQPGDESKPPGPEGPPGPEAPSVAAVEPQQQAKPGRAGILAFRDKFASLPKDDVSARLGAEARYGDVDGDSESSLPSRSMLTTNEPGSSGGINLASLSRRVGGGSGRGGGGGGGIHGVPLGRATSAIAAIGGGGGGGGGGGFGGGHGAGGGRPLSHGPGLSRTDEEIQIVFDRYKASFYRLYNRELRNDPTLQGQMVLRLTIEPDGSVSMCKLQSSDMNAPELAAQVVNRVLTINFGAKEGVQAVTIVYPIDFLPAA